MVDKIARETVGIVTSIASGYIKIATHPFYKLRGDATLDERLYKAKLPFGQGIDEDGIASGRKFLLGYTAQSIDCWSEFPKKLSIKS